MNQPPSPRLPATVPIVAPDGARQRFDALYDREHANVLRFILRRLPHADVGRAEEIAGDVFLAAWRRLGEIRLDVSAERAWLYATARNCLLNEQRATARRGALHIRLAAETSQIVPPPDGAIHHRLDLAAAWNSLKPNDQEVLALEIWEDLSSAEAGRVLGISASAYRFRLHRARRALRAALEPQPAFEPSTHLNFATE